MRIPIWKDLRLSVWERQNPDAVRIVLARSKPFEPVRRVLSSRRWMLLWVRYDWRDYGRPEDALATAENGAWHTVWLEGNWPWVTKKMPTPQREYAADRVAAYSRYLAACDGDLERQEPEGLRWWRGDR